MVFTDLCPPALIYLLFSITQVVIDTVKGLYNTALIKIWVAVIFTILLNYLCQSGLGIISWLIVFIPFILMTLVVSILLLMFGLDPSTGKIKFGKNGKIKKKDEHKHHKHGEECNNHDHHMGNGKCPKKLMDDDGGDDINTGKDKILDYYNKYPTVEGEGGGGGVSGENDDLDDDNNQDNKDNKILQKSFLYYSTKEEDPSKKIQNGNKKSKDGIENAATYNNENSINDVKYKLFVDDITTMLYGMGEQDIASWFKNKANVCLTNLEGSKKKYKQMKIEECFQDILDEMLSKFNNNKKNLFKSNYKERVCQINETMDICKNRVTSGWWS
jgi:hypothetical protein